jgi:hypothetical protein
MIASNRGTLVDRSLELEIYRSPWIEPSALERVVVCLHDGKPILWRIDSANVASPSNW